MPSSSFQWSIKNAFTTAFALECQLWVFCGSAPAQTVFGPIREQCALTSSWLQNADWIILVYLRSNYGCEYFYGLEKDSWGVRVWEWGVSALDAINRIKNGACIYAKKWVFWPPDFTLPLVASLIRIIFKNPMIVRFPAVPELFSCS